MKNRISKKAVFISIFLIMSLMGILNAQTEFKVGDVFPAITLPSLADGQPTSIEEYRGRKVILHIFASW